MNQVSRIPAGTRLAFVSEAARSTAYFRQPGVRPSLQYEEAPAGRNMGTVVRAIYRAAQSLIRRSIDPSVPHLSSGGWTR
jgi:hypothetical protein